MPAVSKDRALELLTHEVREKFGADELLEVYNEVFPNDPSTEEAAHGAVTPMTERLVDHVNSGLDIAEVIDFWRLIFPRHRKVWYDEEELATDAIAELERAVEELNAVLALLENGEKK